MPPPIVNLEPAYCAGAAPQRSARSAAIHVEERLCSEIRLNLRPQLWASFQDGSGGVGPSTPPYWALEWPGGQALARYILDHPEIVARRIVVDWGAGCGLVGIAAALAGATLVRAIDRDPRSIEAVHENASLNGVSQRVVAIQAELPSPVGGDGEAILAADLWYDRFDAMRITAALRSLAKRGLPVLLGDTDRVFTPRGYVTILSRYSIPTDPEIEQTRLTSAHVAHLCNATEIRHV
jgi:predicted nicotinamide N-methyase